MFDVLAPLRDLRAAMALPFAVAALAVVAAPAQATLTPLTPTSPVGGPGTAESEFAGPAGVAVNATTGDVYVADTGNNRVQRFTDHGAFISAFGWGVTNGSSALQTCVSGCEAGVAGNGDGQLSNPTGIAVDPSSGDVYVADQGNSRIVRFSAAGAYVGEFGDSGSNPLTALIGGGGIAFGPDGNLYVVDGQHIAVFDPAGNPQANFPSPPPHFPGEGFFSPQALALDSAGNVFVPDTFYGAAVQEYAPSGSLLRVLAQEGSQLTGGYANTTAVAVNLGNDHVLVAEQGGFDAQGFRLIEFDSAGHRVNTITAAGIIGATTGMAYNPAANLLDEPGALYVVDSAESRLVILAPLVAAPTIRDVRPVAIKAVTANLIATVNSNFRDTKYRFEYGTSTSYGATTPAAPGADLGHTGDDVPVTAKLSGLAPSTTYHFRAIATNSLGTTYSGDWTLRTDRLATKFLLPDNRAYEQVSPVDKNNTEVLNPEAADHSSANSQAAPDGSSIAYGTAGGYPGADASVRRGVQMSFNLDGRWLTRGLDPLTGVSDVVAPPAVLAISRDMSHSVVFSRLALTPGAVNNDYNYYMRENRTGAVKLILSSNIFDLFSFFVGGSTNFDHVYITSMVPLTSEGNDYTANFGTSPRNVYEWTDGRLKLATIGTDGTAVGVDFDVSRMTSGSSRVSQDGRRFFFAIRSPAFGGNGPAYLREGGETVAMSVSHRSADAGVEVQADLTAVSADGTKAYFTSDRPLTDDAHGNRTELYEFDADTRGLRAVSGDFDLAGSSDGQTVRGPIAVTASGSTVYYSVANASESKIVVVRGGVSRVVASYDTPDGAPKASAGSQTSPSGRFLTFARREVGTAAAPQIYRYDAETGGLVCVSCRPTGEASEGGSHTSSNQPGGDIGEGLPPYEARSVTDTGQVFFETSDPLVPEDTNGKQDVYEWENGAPYLLSDGQSDSNSYYLDASESGDHVFITTHARLVGQDRDDVGDVYDVRVNGGIASQNPGDPPASCVNDACQGEGEKPAALPTPASMTFAGTEGAAPTRVVKGQRKVKVSKPVVSRTGFTVKVTTPGKGRIRAAGAGVATVSKSVTKAGVYKVTVRLTAKAKRTLKSKKKLKVSVRVSFTPQAGAASSTSVSVTLKA